ncbi:MAG: alpha/beta hydrolase [Parafilimonas sp.]|nr:alpha/beta hydrolase [Parafilimonas sp.]
MASKTNQNKNNTVSNQSTNFSYDTSDVFKGSVLKNIVFNSKAVNYKGDELQLALDIYKPPHSEGKKFPTVVLVHGGSFIGGDKNNLSSTCSKLANNGYVAVSINYRLGWGFISRAASNCNDSVHLKQAMYRAAQDTHAALRFIAKHANEYNINKNWIFLGGQSAGAITALAAAYLKDKDINAFFSDDYAQKLGPIDKDENDTAALYTLKGVISMWGAFLNPELITNETALPTIFFQGQLDKAVPFDSRAFVPCDNATFVYGTLPLYNRLKALNETAIAHVDPKGGHGVFAENFRVENILCFLNDVQQGIKKQVYLTGIQYSCGKNN